MRKVVKMRNSSRQPCLRLRKNTLREAVLSYCQKRKKEKSRRKSFT